MQTPIIPIPRRRSCACIFFICEECFTPFSVLSFCGFFSVMIILPIGFCLLLRWKDVSGSETAGSGHLCWSCPTAGQLCRSAAWITDPVPQALSVGLQSTQVLPSGRCTDLLEKTRGHLYSCFHFCFIWKETPCAFLPAATLINLRLILLDGNPNLPPHPGLFRSGSLTCYYFINIPGHISER